MHFLSKYTSQVGAGTKTRRPIALQMQYNQNYATPVCFLTREDGREEQRSLEDIQVNKIHYICIKHVH
jgi:hypothetical protein